MRQELYRHERHRITKRQLVIRPEAPEDALSLHPYPVAVSDDAERGLHLVEEGERPCEARPIAEESDGLTNDVPGRPEGGPRGGCFHNEPARLLMVFVGWIEAA